MTESEYAYLSEQIDRRDTRIEHDDQYQDQDTDQEQDDYATD